MLERAGDATQANAGPPRRLKERVSPARQSKVAVTCQPVLAATDGSAMSLGEIRRLHDDAELIVGLQ